MKPPSKPVLAIALVAAALAVLAMYAAVVYALSGDWDLSPSNKLYAFVAGFFLSLFVATSVFALHSFFHVRRIWISAVAASEVMAISFTFYVFNALIASC